MRTEAEIREKLKEIKEGAWRTGDILKSSMTPYLIETRLLEWVLGEFEYPTNEENRIMLELLFNKKLIGDK